MTPVPGGFIFDLATWWKVTFYAAIRSTPVVGDGRGLIYYSLERIALNRPKLQTQSRVVRQLQVADWIKDNIRLPSLAPVVLSESTLRAQEAIKISGLAITVGLLVRFKTALLLRTL
ncbi:hypothetical protein HED60_19560 [Planctomycetales bacterium ZRK34]|nr:hypothetical protein HED60_19560 [Planctomycetales bacterium ZRK34]